MSLNWSIPIKYVVDNDPQKWGGFFNNIEVHAPADLLSIKNPEKCAILITTKNTLGVIHDIHDMGLTMDYYDAESLDPQPFCMLASKKYYSLYGEDAVLKGICDRYGISINSYIDIGANHPVNGNATYLFYLNGARGYLIEPNVDYAALLKRTRPKDEIIILGIASEDKTKSKLVYYSFKDRNTRNTFDKQRAEKVSEMFHISYSEETIEVKSLNALFKEDIREEVDFVNMDIEGLEWDALKDFDFKEYPIKSIMIEKSNDNIKNLLFDNGYVLVAETLSNWIFMLKELIQD